MSILASLIKDILFRKHRASPSNMGQNHHAVDDRRQVLNVGGSSKQVLLPNLYGGWDHILLDIDPRHGPDLLCDARELETLAPLQFDAVYCAHNLEHYFRHDVPTVLRGFSHVLKEDGFVHIRVPDMGELMRTVVRKNLDIDDRLYESPAGPITVLDVIYGHGEDIERSGSDFFAHKTGFTRKSLTDMLTRCGFGHVYALEQPDILEIQAFAFKRQPGAVIAAMLGLPPPVA